jgi:hypothetical protein
MRKHPGGPPPRKSRHKDASGLQGKPFAVVTQRLRRVRRTARGATASCPGPNHRRGDRTPSLSISEGPDGRVLLHCHAQCPTEEIVRALGLELRDLFPPSGKFPEGFSNSRTRRRIGRGTATSDPEIWALVEPLAWRRTLPFEWAIAKTLAPLSPRLMRDDILRSWDWIVARGDVETILQMAYAVRGIAMFAYCSSKTTDDATIARAVRRLLVEVSS